MPMRATQPSSRLSRNCGSPSPSLIHSSLRLTRVWSAGAIRFGSSRLQVVRSISSRAPSSSKASWVPHSGQKLRVAFSLDLNLAGSPAKRNCERGTLNQATNGAPLVRRQIEQWQLVRLNAGPRASYRTRPQKQPPVSIGSSLLAGWYSAGARRIALAARPARMQEDCLVAAQPIERGRHDVARARKPRLGVTNPAAALPALGFQPRVEQAEVFAAMVGLAVFVAPRPSVQQDGRVLGLPVAHAGDVLGDVDRRVGVVPDPEQQHLAVELV